MASSLLDRSERRCNWSAEIEFQVVSRPVGHWESIPFDADTWKAEASEADAVQYENFPNSLITLASEITDRQVIVARDYADFTMIMRDAAKHGGKVSTIVPPNRDTNVTLRTLTNGVLSSPSLSSLQSRDGILSLQKLQHTTNVNHFKGLSCRQGTVTSRSLRAAMGCNRAIRTLGPNGLAFSDWMLSPSRLLYTLRRGFYVQFYPLDEVKACQVRFIQRADSLVLITPIGRFLAAPFGIISHHKIAGFLPCC